MIECNTYQVVDVSTIHSTCNICTVRVTGHCENTWAAEVLVCLWWWWWSRPLGILPRPGSSSLTACYLVTPHYYNPQPGWPVNSIHIPHRDHCTATIWSAAVYIWSDTISTLNLARDSSSGSGPGGNQTFSRSNVLIQGRSFLHFLRQVHFGISCFHTTVTEWCFCCG